MAKLQEFIASVKKTGLMRTANYSVLFPPLAPRNTNALIGMYCDQIQMPGYNMNTVASYTYGESREMPYGRLYDPITASFYVDNNMEVKKYFDDWLFRIQSPHNRTFSYYERYTVDMQVNIEDLNQNVKYSYKLYECYPKTIGSIDMSYASKELMKLPVTFVYKYWKPYNERESSEPPIFINNKAETAEVVTGTTRPLTIQYDALEMANRDIAAAAAIKAKKGSKYKQYSW